MTDFLVQVFVLTGSVFVFLAAVGVARMPDLYMRLSTVTKGGTMGVGLLLVAVVLELPDAVVLVKTIAVIAFAFITSPVAAHFISRAAYFHGVALWDGTVVDELRGQYEERSHELSHPPDTITERTGEKGEG